MSKKQDSVQSFYDNSWYNVSRLLYKNLFLTLFSFLLISGSIDSIALGISNPQDVEATPGSCPNTINVSWRGAGETIVYSVYRNREGQPGGCDMADIIAVTENAYITDCDRVPGEVYYYWVKATGFDGDSACNGVSGGGPNNFATAPGDSTLGLTFQRDTKPGCWTDKSWYERWNSDSDTYPGEMVTRSLFLMYPPPEFVFQNYTVSWTWQVASLDPDFLSLEGYYELQNDLYTQTIVANENVDTFCYTGKTNVTHFIYASDWGRHDDCTCASPLPDIKANGLDEPFDMQQADNLSVTVSLNPESFSGIDGDWWVVADTPFGRFSYSLSLGWKPGLFVTHQGPLFGLFTYFEVLNVSGLPVGSYTFYFAVDTNMNGSLDLDQLYYDSVVVNITP